MIRPNEPIPVIARSVATWRSIWSYSWIAAVGDLLRNDKQECSFRRAQRRTNPFSWIATTSLLEFPMTGGVCEISGLTAKAHRTHEAVSILAETMNGSNQFKKSTQTAFEIVAVWGVAVSRPVFGSTRNTVRLFES